MFKNPFNPPTNNPTRPHAPEILIQVDTGGWNGRMENAIRSRNHLKIVVRGNKASRFKSYAGMAVPAPPAPSAPIPSPNLAYAARMCELGLLATLLVQAGASGYSSFRAIYNSNSSGANDDEFIIWAT